MKINSNDFQVKPGKKIDLSKWPTRVKPVCKSEKKYQKLLRVHVAELSSLQNLHYASNKSALLLIFQGMVKRLEDAGVVGAGHDGAALTIPSDLDVVCSSRCDVYDCPQLFEGPQVKQYEQFAEVAVSTAEVIRFVLSRAE